MKIYVAAGVISNLFSLILPLLEGFQIFATIKPETMLGSGIRFISVENGLRTRFDRVLCFSTHDEPKLLEKYAYMSPTLAISSGEILDYYLGLQREEDLNPYQKSKLAICRVPGIFAFVPGFFIEDIETPFWASKGLHGKSNQIIFGPSVDAPEFDWNKAYSVTPKSMIQRAMISWIENPKNFAQSAPLIVCSDRQYYRHELRTMSQKEEHLPLLPEIYLQLSHGIRVRHEEVSLACKRAAKIQSMKE